VHGQDNVSVSEYVYTVHLQPRRCDAQWRRDYDSATTTRIQIIRLLSAYAGMQRVGHTLFNKASEHTNALKIRMPLTLTLSDSSNDY